MIVFFILIIIGFVLLCKGADILVDGASNIAKKLRIPEIVIGLTIVAFGTSLPELIISLDSAMNGFSDISIGNVIGSCLCNLLLVLGFTAIARKVPVDKSSLRISLPIFILSSIILMIFGNIGEDISRLEGFFLLLISEIFIINIWLTSKQDENKEYVKIGLLKSIVKIFVGIIFLKYGGDFVVDNSVKIAERLNISQKIIGLTIVSIGTSLPELVTGIVASKKGETDLALGNILGSNIFNILIVLGTVAIINPISYSYEFNFSIILLILINFLILWFSFSKERNMITKNEGKVLLWIYVGYIVQLIVNH